MAAKVNAKKDDNSLQCSEKTWLIVRIKFYCLSSGILKAAVPCLRFRTPSWIELNFTLCLPKACRAANHFSMVA